mmetsp:Transcript_3145/g.9168  ORF Transcript_3145/g.9168 Transcript_3145/m.9168 type:complete len:208 (+) Transcript_3145:541-1164(+)
MMPQCRGRSPGDLRMQSIRPSPLSIKPTRSMPSFRVHACKCSVFNLFWSAEGTGPYFFFQLFVSSTNAEVLSARRAAVSSTFRSFSSGIYDSGIWMALTVIMPSFVFFLISRLPSCFGKSTLVRGTKGRSSPRSNRIDFFSMRIYKSNPTRAAIPLCSVPSRLPAPLISKSRLAMSKPDPSSESSPIACRRIMACSVMDSSLCSRYA